MKSKAREELKPQQPNGCEDFDDDRNAAIRYFATSVSSISPWS